MGNIFVKLKDPSTIYRNTDVSGQHIYVKNDHVIEVPYDLVKAPIAAGVLVEVDEADYVAFNKAKQAKLKEAEQQQEDNLDEAVDKAKATYEAAVAAKQAAKDAEDQATKDAAHKAKIKEAKTLVNELSKQIADEKDQAKLKTLNTELAKAQDDLKKLIE